MGVPLRVPRPAGRHARSPSSQVRRTGYVVRYVADADEGRLVHGEPRTSLAWDVGGAKVRSACPDERDHGGPMEMRQSASGPRPSNAGSTGRSRNLGRASAGSLMLAVRTGRQRSARLTKALWRSRETRRLEALTPTEKRTSFAPDETYQPDQSDRDQLIGSARIMWF